jgi:hypothetical protein
MLYEEFKGKIKPKKNVPFLKIILHYKYLYV